MIPLKMDGPMVQLLLLLHCVADHKIRICIHDIYVAPIIGDKITIIVCSVLIPSNKSESLSAKS